MPTWKKGIVMKIIVLTGMPASGKSTIAKKLSAEFNMPILEKDALKEELFDTIGFNCYAEKRKLDIAANAVLLRSVETLLSKKIPMIIDNNFDTDSTKRFIEILKCYKYTCITVFLGGETDAFYKRYVERDNLHLRHLGHVLQEHYPPREGDSLEYEMTREEFAEKFEKRGMNHFNCPGPRIDIDATEPWKIDVDALIEKIKFLMLPKSDICPFQMHQNLYFVGSSRVSVHIIKTEKGLVMIDTGYPDMFEQVLDSMNILGLNPKDICAIFHSHGHYDHFGCTLKFKELSGAKTYISRIDNALTNGTRNLSLSKEPFQAFDCDVLVDDGDVFTFGNTTIRCKLTPGHTDGTLSFFVTLRDGEESVVAAMHGGIGFNSMTADFLKHHNLSFDCREKFREGLHALANEHVDIVIGNHPGQTNTIGKLEKVLAGKSALDKTEWNRFLNRIEKKFDDLIKKEEEV